jgi:hypothetical protein
VVPVADMLDGRVETVDELGVRKRDARVNRQAVPCQPLPPRRPDALSRNGGGLHRSSILAASTEPVDAAQKETVEPLASRGAAAARDPGGSR